MIHPKYHPVLFPKTRRTDICGGRGGGRSHILSVRAFRDLTGDEYSFGVYLRQFKNSHRHSTFAALQQRIQESGLPSKLFSINQSTLETTYKPNGNKVIFLGAHGAKGDSARLKSIESANKLYCEEATEIGESDLRKIEESLRTTRGTIREFLAYNPPDAEHHIMKTSYVLTPTRERYYDAFGSEIQVFDYTPRTDSGITLVRTDYTHNPHIAPSTIDMYERYRTIDLTHYLTVIKGYVGGLPGGLVYRHFLPLESWEFDIMPAKSFYVLDFGFSNDPCCLLECKAFNDSIYYKLRIYGLMDDFTLAKRMIDIGIHYTDVIIADYGNGGDVRINTLRTAGAGQWRNVEGYPQLADGFSVIYAKKGAGSIIDGIEVVKSKQIFVCDCDTIIWDEMREYKWALDRNNESTGKPVDKNNHAMDCIRYAATYVAKYGVPV